MSLKRMVVRLLPDAMVDPVRAIFGAKDKRVTNRRMAALEEGLRRTMPQLSLDYLVLNILDHCNLRCKGCDHFAAIAKKRFVSLQDISADLVRFSELLHGDVRRISVMGGEPLLHPDLKEILIQTRLHFPNTRIELVTNGILLLRQSDEFWATCREADVGIVNTKYPIELDHAALAETARKQGVRFRHYGVTGALKKFAYKVPLDLEGKQDPRRNFIQCSHANNCVMLMEGKVWTCTVAPNAHIFNEKFGTDLATVDGDYLDIYEAQSGSEVLEFLAKPIPFCRYCNVRAREHGLPWERSKQDMSEWLAGSPPEGLGRTEPQEQQEPQDPTL